MANAIKSLIVPRENAILYHMSIGTKNWGDALNPVLIRHISGKEPVLAYRMRALNDFPLYSRSEPVYSVIGSILKTASAKDNLIVWGSGFMGESDRLVKEPKKILAVRGHLTRDRIVDLGFDCPKVLGDPALLYPQFYKPNSEKQYNLGIIPHYLDRNSPFLERFRSDSNIRIIDICSGINKVVEEIHSCRYIASSSLHGIIVADSYGIPSTWIEFSKNVPGNGFKFYDYFSSVCRRDDEPHVIIKDTALEDIYDRFYRYDLKINLDQLLAACPFNNTDIKVAF